MRDALRARAAAGADAGLDQLVLRALSAPPAATAPGRSETARPREAGVIGASDSG